MSTPYSMKDLVEQIEQAIVKVIAADVVPGEEKAFGMEAELSTCWIEVKISKRMKVKPS